MIGSPVKSFLWLSEPFLAALLIRILGATWKIKFEGLSLIKKHSSRFFYVFWHENMFPLLFTYRGRKAGVIVSPSRDGELMSRVLKLFGFKVFRGDTKSHGSRALMKLIKYGNKGFEIAITPDGPKGPRRKAKMGTFLIAKRTDIPILAIRVKADRAFRFSSWDKLMLPYPFSRITIELNEFDKKSGKKSLEKLLSSEENFYYI
jgi:lysophospholipid acyltransferase (LPLAT)-like uncharacterized protein